MWFDSRFDKQLYLTIYMDIGLAAINPKEHFTQFGHAENRQESLKRYHFAGHEIELENEIPYILNNGSLIKMGNKNSYTVKKNIEVWEIKWRPKRPEWGWLIKIPVSKPSKKIEKYAYLRNMSECMKFVGGQNYKTLDRVFHNKLVNISHSKNAIYIFVNLGFYTNG